MMNGIISFYAVFVLFKQICEKLSSEYKSLGTTLPKRNLNSLKECDPLLLTLMYKYFLRLYFPSGVYKTM